MRQLQENEFGGYQDILDPTFEVSKSEARWLVETGKAVIAPDPDDAPHIVRAETDTDNRW